MGALSGARRVYNDNMLKVVTNGPGINDWIVKAEWHGAERIVYGPTDVFDACRWAAQHKEG